MLYRHNEQERNELIEKTGLDILTHRSRECDPCVNANRYDLRRLHSIDIEKTKALEESVCKTMFRPKRHMGAEGIVEVIKWANSKKGKYKLDDDETSAGCGSNFGCGL